MKKQIVTTLTSILLLQFFLASCGYHSRNQNCIAGQPCSIDQGSTSSAPVPGAAISFTNQGDTGITVNWGAATDDKTTASHLIYRLVTASSAAELESLTKAQLVSVLSDQTKTLTGTTTQLLDGLKDGKTYYFAVMVTDEDGYTSYYSPQAVTLPDVMPPQFLSPLYASNIGSTSLKLNWGVGTDNVTPSDELMYKIVSSNTVADLLSLETADALTGNHIVADWTTNISETTLSSLTSSSLYAYAVLVKDAAGNKSIQGPVLVQTLDVSAPTIGSLTVSVTTGTSFQLAWTAASDDVSLPTNLEYKVVISTDPSQVDTLAKAKNLTGAQLVSDWDLNYLSKNISSLTNGTSYYVAVLVRDEVGNTSMYGPQKVTTLDTEPPTIGSGITFRQVTANSIGFNWGNAQDNVTSTSLLQYRVVLAPQAEDIDTSAEVAALAGSQVVVDWTSDLLKAQVIDLSSYTQYYFAVVVRDAAENMSLYPPQSAKTLDQGAPQAPQILEAPLTGSTVNLKWSKGIDAEVSESQLVYRLVTSTDKQALDSVDEVVAMSDASVLMEWSSTKYQGSKDLAADSVSYFVVAVKDPSGNTSISSIYKVVAPDATAPVPGNSGFITKMTSNMGTMFSANWTAATDNVNTASELEYLPVSATQSSDIDTIEKAVNKAGSDRTCHISSFGWSPQLRVDGHTHEIAQNCYVAVLVRDRAGNKSLYAPVRVYNPEVPPSFSEGISFANVATTTVDVLWGKALTINGSAPQYRLVKATSASAIDTIDKVEAITGANLILDYTTDTTTANATGLTQASTVYFAVVVKDDLGNKALYTPTSVTTLDPPTIGTVITTGAQTRLNLFSLTAVISWGAASDVQSAASKLKYKVVRAFRTTEIDTGSKISNCAGTCTTITDWTANITTVNSTVPTVSKFYVGVAVRDESGAISVYSPISMTSLSYSPFLFNTGVFALLSRSAAGSVNTALVVESNNGSDFVQKGADFGALYQGDNGNLFVDSSGTYWATLSSYKCNGWVNVAQIYKYSGSAWSQAGNNLQGTTAHCSGFSGTTTGNLFEVDTDIAVYQTESRGTWQGVLRNNNATTPVANWAAVTGRIYSGGISALKVGTTTYVFGDNGINPFARTITGSGGPPLTLTETNLNFGATIPLNKSVEEPAGGTGQRLAYDSGANKIYVAYIDPNYSLKASVRVYDVAGTTWSDVGTLGFSAGEVSNISILYHGKPYVLFKDFTRGGDATLMSWNGTAWINEHVNIFGGEVLTPLMIYNSGTNQIDVFGVKTSATSKATKVSF